LRETQHEVPVIMITAFGGVENYIKSMSLGVFEYINKPVDKEEFERIVRMALQKS
jgi:DNA-binding NtrC family response regulator